MRPRATGSVVPTAAERASGDRVHADRDRLVGWARHVRRHRRWPPSCGSGDLGRPHTFLFDETYYAKDAWSLVHHGYVTGYVDDANKQILAGQLMGSSPIRRRWSCTPRSANG